MTIHHRGKMLLVALGMATLLTGCCNVGIWLDKKYDNPQDFNKVFAKGRLRDPQVQVINFVYYEAKLKPWAFWNISYYIYPESVYEAELLVTPAWLHKDGSEWEIHNKDEQYFKDLVLKDRLADWFAPDSANYEVWFPDFRRT